MKVKRLVLLLLTLLFSGCMGNQGSEGITVVPVRGQPQLVKLMANPDRGYNYPAYLWIPADFGEEDIHRILVTPNNTGTTSDSFRVHEKKVKQTMSGGNWEYYVGLDLNVPHLMPVFPRPRRDWHFYTHSLDRDTMELSSGEMERLDLQLIRMIDDARDYLKGSRNITLEEQILLSGFSASGTFSNRFTMLHPDKVRAAAYGGVNAIPLLPLSEYGGYELPFHIGVSDLNRYIEGGFHRESWRKVSQYIYMGSEDDNDTTEYDDGYTREEAQLVWDTVGKEMSKRWENCMSIYLEASPNVQLVTYEGLGHAAVVEDMVSFLRANGGDGFYPIEPSVFK